MYDTINRPRPHNSLHKSSLCHIGPMLTYPSRKTSNCSTSFRFWAFLTQLIFILVLVVMTLVLILIFYLGSNICLYILGLCVSLQLLSPLCCISLKVERVPIPALMYFARSLLDFPLEHCSNPTIFVCQNTTDAL